MKDIDSKVNIEKDEFISYLQKEGSTPSVHPNGFIIIRLRDDLRIHFWHHSIPKQDTRVPIHDHIWDIKCFVLKGRMINVTHEYKKSQDGDLLVCSPIGDDGGLTPLGYRFNKEREYADVIKEGETYGIDRRKFHESIPAEPTVTIMKKLDWEEGESCRVVAPSEKNLDTDFDRYNSMSDVETWKLINEMVDKKVLTNYQKIKNEL